MRESSLQCPAPRVAVRAYVRQAKRGLNRPPYAAGASSGGHGTPHQRLSSGARSGSLHCLQARQRWQHIAWPHHAGRRMRQQRGQLVKRLGTFTGLARRWRRWRCHALWHLLPRLFVLLHRRWDVRSKARQLRQLLKDGTISLIHAANGTHLRRGSRDVSGLVWQGTVWVKVERWWAGRQAPQEHMI